MAPTRTRTVKNKHAANKSGIRNSKAAKDGKPDVVLKAKQSKKQLPLTSRANGRPSLLEQLRKRKQKTYTEKELDLPKLNMITPAGVQKPRGKKKGKIYVDDRVRAYPGASTDWVEDWLTG
jgi:60S ribosomal subunit assembly/export protein LOC1